LASGRQSKGRARLEVLSRLYQAWQDGQAALDDGYSRLSGETTD
jgi:hypothetical protein